MRQRWVITGLACLSLVGAAKAVDAPEAASGFRAKPGWEFPKRAVASANPLASHAGLRILREGGSALDAAVAVQMVLALVEPQSSGLGGGAFLLHHDGQRVQAWDGRETAPAEATEDLFIVDGKPMGLAQAVVGGRAVGVPGVVRMLEMAHRQQGRLPWAQLIAPAIDLAQKGFPVSERLHSLLAQDTALRQDPVAAAYFYQANGQAWPVGHVLKNPEMAQVLRRVAERGAAALHEGPVAEAMVRTVRSHPHNPGRLSLQDLVAYQARERTPLCFDTERPLQGAYRVCGFPPPSSGALAIGQIFGLMARATADPAAATWGPAWVHRYTEAARLAFADRAHHVADPDFVAAPHNDWTSLWSASYLQGRAQAMGLQRMPTPSHGQPGAARSAWGTMAEQTEHGTSHLSVVDGEGRSVAMTTTIESGFGARLMVNTGQGLTGGFLLNNQLTDFSFLPRDAQGRPIANRVEPGKRPRSSMSPTLVFERLPDGRTGPLVASLGSPGGTLIIHFTAQTLWALLKWDMTPQQAIDLPRLALTDPAGPLYVEAQRFTADWRADLAGRGHRVIETPLTSGLQALQRTASGWRGGADPRREGDVAGD
jgi:gamma-glutamyltranspeptidase/glutathione hydrolase